MPRRIPLAAALLLATAIPAFAQQNIRSLNLAYAWDVDSTTQTYPKLLGRFTSPSAEPIPGSANIETSGSSTTTTAVSGTPFDPVAVGDILVVRLTDGTELQRVVDAKASGASITVDTAWDLDVAGGVSFGWLDFSTGTGVGDGWIPVPPSSEAGFTLWVQYDQGDLTGGLDVQFQCRGSHIGAAPFIVYPGSASDCGFGTLSTTVCTFTTAGGAEDNLAVTITPNVGCSAVRVGLKANTADPGDAGANRERVTVGLSYAR